MNMVMLAVGAVITSAVWLLYIRTSNTQREEYRRALANKDRELNEERKASSYRAGFRKAERMGSDNLIDIIRENADLHERILELQKENEILRTSQHIIEVR